MLLSSALLVLARLRIVLIHIPKHSNLLSTKYAAFFGGSTYYRNWAKPLADWDFSFYYSNYTILCHTPVYFCNNHTHFLSNFQNNCSGFSGSCTLMGCNDSSVYKIHAICINNSSIRHHLQTILRWKRNVGILEYRLLSIDGIVCWSSFDAIPFFYWVLFKSMIN